MIIFQMRQEVVVVTTEEFEKELRKLQEVLHLTEEQIQNALRMHRRFKAGEISPLRIKKE